MQATSDPRPPVAVLQCRAPAVASEEGFPAVLPVFKQWLYELQRVACLGAPAPYSISYRQRHTAPSVRRRYTQPHANHCR